mmetsp:Transcript_4860/g.7256  ORF Transcript_4860/g.7256 Transcript_4860/m.7256 type:complete len:305 (+) Transcript_4860:2418-3332(+)
MVAHRALVSGGRIVELRRGRLGASVLGRLGPLGRDPAKALASGRRARTAALAFHLAVVQVGVPPVAGLAHAGLAGDLARHHVASEVQGGGVEVGVELVRAARAPVAVGRGHVVLVGPHGAHEALAQLSELVVHAVVHATLRARQADLGVGLGEEARGAGQGGVVDAVEVGPRLQGVGHPVVVLRVGAHPQLPDVRRVLPHGQRGRAALEDVGRDQGGVGRAADGKLGVLRALAREGPRVVHGRQRQDPVRVVAPVVLARLEGLRGERVARGEPEAADPGGVHEAGRPRGGPEVHLHVVGVEPPA